MIRGMKVQLAVYNASNVTKERVNFAPDAASRRRRSSGPMGSSPPRSQATTRRELQRTMNRALTALISVGCAPAEAEPVIEGAVDVVVIESDYTTGLVSGWSVN